jgi:hypothetical protein
MACRRCGGFMIVEVGSPFSEDPAPSELQRSRCLNCGSIEDSVICQNRMGRICGHGSIARLSQGIRL